MLGSDKFPLVQMAGEYSSLIRLGYDLINYQDMQCVENCNDPDPTHHVLYEQPVWQTLQMFRTHYISSLEQAFLTTELVGEMLCQSHTLKSSLRNPSSCAICIFFFPPGFLPVLYTWLRTKQQSSVHLAPDSENDNSKVKDHPQHLHGWKILLLWIPAICDLSGTTASLPSFCLQQSAHTRQ